MSATRKRIIVAIVALMITAPSAVVANVGPHGFELHRSHMTVYVYKRGFFSFAADNHEIEAPIISGSFDESKKLVDVTVSSSKLKVVDPKLAADRRASVQANMSGPAVLDSVKYPQIVFHSSSVSFDGTGHGHVTGDLTLHGQTHAIVVDLTRADATHFTGSSMVRQSSFGITPIRIMGGAVTVADEVKVVFDIYLEVR
jgi:polyisoprenoid-binding protein YceI